MVELHHEPCMMIVFLSVQVRWDYPPDTIFEEVKLTHLCGVLTLI